MVQTGTDRLNARRNYFDWKSFPWKSVFKCETEQDLERKKSIDQFLNFTIFTK